MCNMNYDMKKIAKMFHIILRPEKGMEYIYDT